MGVWGVWNELVTTSSNDSGTQVFQEWLQAHNNGCNPVGSITTWGSGFPITAADLEPYSVIILLDLYHSNADRWGCLRNWSCCPSQKCYNTSGVTSGCGANATTTGTSTTASALAGCTATNTTSYNLGTAPALTEAEVDVIEAWVRKGGGLVTTSGYYYNNPEACLDPAPPATQTCGNRGNMNRILRRFNLRYESYDNDQPGRVPNPLPGTNGWGVDVCGNGATGCDGGGDFMAGSPPFSLVKLVKRLQIRTAAPLTTINYNLTVSPQLAAAVQCERSRPAENTGCSPSIAACINSATSSANPTNWRSNSPWKVAHTVDGLFQAPNTTQPGRVVAWGDDWMTYNTVWNAGDSCGSGYVYQAAEFWENVVKWLGKCSL
jgi:hypothetical protein